MGSVRNSVSNETEKRQRQLPWGLIFACWTLYGLFFGGYVWAILTPPVLYLSERFRIERQNWVRGVSIHLPASICCSLLLLSIYVAVRRLIGLPNKQNPYLVDFKNLFIVEFHLGVLTYWVILGFKHAL